MATPDLPQGQSPGHRDDGNASKPRFPDRSRLEETLVKSSIWKKQTLRNIESTRSPVASETNDRDTRTARLLARLSAQLDERNDEIEQLRRIVSRLQNEKSELGRAHRLELERLQDAYDQFEKESDSLLSELGQKNERLLDDSIRE